MDGVELVSMRALVELEQPRENEKARVTEKERESQMVWEKWELSWCFVYKICEKDELLPLTPSFLAHLSLLPVKDRSPVNIVQQPILF